MSDKAVDESCFVVVKDTTYIHNIMRARKAIPMQNFIPGSEMLKALYR